VTLVLNGTSSAGTTSLARRCGGAGTGRCSRSASTGSCSRCPAGGWRPPGRREVFVYTGSGDALRITAGRPARRRAARSVAALADQGFDVVVDHVLLSPAWVADAMAAFGDGPVLSVRCPLAEGGPPGSRAR
jgi:chloramphenicol 3-O-phosphotransferase